MFYDKALRLSTITHYRFTLSLPLQLKWGIDLRVPEINQLLRAMRIQRPKAITTAPSWKLSSVLNFLEKGTEPTSEVMVLRKAAFLVLLAIGWRISKLHECVREEEFCRFSENSTLTIRPHPSSLAKNEGKEKGI